MLDGALHAIVGVLPEAAAASPFDHLQVWVPRPADVVQQSQLALSTALLLIAEAAAFFPARRATRIDPVIALRAGQRHTAFDLPRGGTRAAAAQ